MADDDQIAILRAEIDSLRSQVARMEASAPLGNRGQQWQLDEHDIQIKRLLAMLGAPQVATSGGTGGLVLVNLALAGGANGTVSGPPTYVYNATTTAGVTIAGSPFTPQFGRPNGSFLQATKGVGYFDASSNFVLVTTNEHWAITGCVLP